MKTIRLKKATKQDTALVVDFDYNLDKVEHVELKRAGKISNAIADEECFLIMADDSAVGFILFDYRFFDNGWIELMVIEEESRGKGIGVQVMDLICNQSNTDKVFTSTNRSNTHMQKALTKAGFSFAGEINGLDNGDPELFYFRNTNNRKSKQA